MTIQDFQIIHSYHKITEVFEFRLFWKVSKNIGFHRNKCKMQIVDGYQVMLLKTDTLFFKTNVIYSLDMLSSFIFMVLLSEIVFYGVQKLKGKRVFRKIKIKHVLHIVSSVAQKRNSSDFSNSRFKLEMPSKVSYQNPEVQALR